MKKQRKQYSRPRKPWDKERIEKEKKILRDFGLRRKKEIWRAEEILRDFRRRARELAASKNEKEEKILLNKLNQLGLISKDANLDAALGLTIENILNRRLQTIIFKKGLANTLKQSRQFIVHGHIALDGKRAKWPSQLITISKENKIGFYGKGRVKQWLQETRSGKISAPKPQEINITAAQNNIGAGKTAMRKNEISMQKNPKEETPEKTLGEKKTNR